MRRGVFLAAAMLVSASCRESCEEKCGLVGARRDQAQDEPERFTCRRACVEACECGLLSPLAGDSEEPERSFVRRCRRSTDGTRGPVTDCFLDARPSSDAGSTCDAEWSSGGTCERARNCLAVLLGTQNIATVRSTIVPYERAPVDGCTQLESSSTECVRTLECGNDVACDAPPALCDPMGAMPAGEAFSPVDVCGGQIGGQQIDVVQIISTANDWLAATIECDDFVRGDIIEIPLIPGRSRIELRVRGTAAGLAFCEPLRSEPFIGNAGEQTFVPVLVGRPEDDYAFRPRGWRCQNTPEYCNDGVANHPLEQPDCLSESCAAFCGEASACSDGRDNDEDGYVDCEDSECWGVGACPDLRPPYRVR